MPIEVGNKDMRNGVATTEPSGTLKWTIPNEAWQYEWASWSAQDKSRITDRYTTHLPDGMSGRYALRIDIVDGDVAYSQGDMSQATYNPLDGPYGERAEVAMQYPNRYLNGTTTVNPDFASQYLHTEGDEEWISWQVYLPSSFDSSLALIPDNYWQNVMQWKGVLDVGVPILLLEANDGTWNLEHWYDGRLGSIAVTSDVWARFTMYVKWSPDNPTGKVQLWCDPNGSGTMTEVVPLTTTLTQENPASGAGVSQTRMGIYRNPTVTGSTWVGYFGYTVATTRDLAEWHAFYETPVAGAPSVTRQTVKTSATLLGVPGEGRSRLVVEVPDDADWPVYFGAIDVAVGDAVVARPGQKIEFSNDSLEADGSYSWYAVADGPVTVVLTETGR